MHALHHPLFIKFMAYFNGNQDYFECHEVLEDYWNEVAPRDKSHPLVGYILTAVGLYHWRRGNFAGAGKSVKKARRNLAGALAGNSPFFDGIDADRLLRSLDEAACRIEAGRPFVPFEIAVTDPLLEKSVELAARGLEGKDSPSLIHKHMLRGRPGMSAGPKKGRDSRH